MTKISCPKVSVIIPTYKRPHLISRAIKSVLNQTYENFEIIIVDDSPDDETEKVVKNFNDPRIKYIHNKKRGNMSKARNQGVRESSPDSKYIAFLDDDDEWFPLFLEETIKILEEKQELIGVNCYAELRLANGKKIGEMREPQERWKITLGNGSVLRKSLFTEDNMWFDEDILFEDLDFAIRVIQNHKIEYIPRVLRIYYGYPLAKKQSLSTSFTPETPVKKIESLYKKNKNLYLKEGKRAVSWIQFITGTTLCKAGQFAQGKIYLRNALKVNPRPTYLIYYLVAKFIPNIFLNFSFIVWKARITSALITIRNIIKDNLIIFKRKHLT